MYQKQNYLEEYTSFKLFTFFLAAVSNFNEHTKTYA